MPTTIAREQKNIDGVVIEEFFLTNKSAEDDFLVRRFGDITVNPSGDFTDPANPTVKFRVDAGPPVSFFEFGRVVAVFDDHLLSLTVLQQRAKIWGDKIQADLQSSMAALRLSVDTTSSSVFIL